MLGATVIAACMLTFPIKAHAACDVPESGIPEDAALNTRCSGDAKVAC